MTLELLIKFINVAISINGLVLIIALVLFVLAWRNGDVKQIWDDFTGKDR